MSKSQKKKAAVAICHPYVRVATTSKAKYSKVSTNQEAASSSSSQRTVESSPYKSISPSDLNIMFEADGGLDKTLILDCRTNNLYENKQLKNSHIIPTFQVPGDKSFPTKKSVLEFYYDQMAIQIVTINRPGHYDNIIVYDDCSTNQSLCPVLKTMLTAISKWNEKTKTKVLFLDGGYKIMTKHFANLLHPINNQFVGVTTPPNFPPIINEFPENPSMNPGSSSWNAQFEMQTFERYMVILDEALKKTFGLHEYRKRFRILKGIKLLLHEEEFDEWEATEGSVERRLEDDIEVTRRAYKVVSEELQGMRHSMVDLEYHRLDDIEEEESPLFPRVLAKQFYSKESSFNELQISLKLRTLARK